MARVSRVGLDAVLARGASNFSGSSTAKILQAQAIITEMETRACKVWQRTEYLQDPGCQSLGAHNLQCKQRKILSMLLIPCFCQRMKDMRESRP